MNENELKKALEQYLPTEGQCRGMKRRIQAERMQRARRGKVVWRAGAAVCAACMIEAVGLLVSSSKQTANVPPGPVSAQESAGQSQVQILALGAGQEEKPQALQIGIEMPLGDYRLESSMTPGFPFVFQWELEGESGEVSVSKGSLLRWDRQTGQVTDAGKQVVCKNGETLYYSPLEGGQPAESDALTIRVAGERQSALIQSREGTYFAKILPEEMQS